MSGDKCQWGVFVGALCPQELNLSEARAFSRLLGVEVRRNFLNSTRLVQCKLVISIFGYFIFFHSVIYSSYQD